MKKSMLLVGLISITALLLSGCTSVQTIPEKADEMAQVPISEQASGEYFPGKFVWHDLLTPDPESAGAFYQGLFGWTVEYQEHYSVVRNRGKLIAGIMKVEPDAEEQEGVWIPSVSIEDVDATAKLVETNGGKILKGPVDLDKRGRAVLIRDSQGANLVLLKTREGDPIDSDAASGDWLWDELWTNTAEQSASFYTRVLGYEQIPVGDAYDVFIDDGKWRAGMRHVGDKMENLVWVPVVRVDDPAKIVQNVSELGGHVLLTPDEAPGPGDTALIADPTGALIIVQQWSDESEAGRSAQ